MTNGKHEVYGFGNAIRSSFGWMRRQRFPLNVMLLVPAVAALLAISFTMMIIIMMLFAWVAVTYFRGESTPFFNWGFLDTIWSHMLNHDLVGTQAIMVMPIAATAYVVLLTGAVLFPSYSPLLIWGTLYVIHCTIFAYADACRWFGIYDSADIHTAPIRDSVSCLYFSMITWTTLGYGDYRPSQGLRLFAASEAILGYLCMAILIAGLINAIQHWKD